MASSRIDNKKVCFPYSGREEQYDFTVTVSGGSYARITQATLGVPMDGYTAVISGFNTNHTGIQIAGLNGGTYAVQVCSYMSSAVSNRPGKLEVSYIDDKWLTAISNLHHDNLPSMG